MFSYRANTATGVTPNNATFANGERLRLAPQVYYYRGSFGYLGEYTQVKQDVSRTVARRHAVRHADQLARGRASSPGSSPAKKKLPRLHAAAAPASRARPAGARWELVARYQELDVDDDAFVGRRELVRQSAHRDHEGNFLRRRRELVSVEHRQTVAQLRHDSFDGGAVDGDRADEQALFSRFAINY